MSRAFRSGFLLNETFCRATTERFRTVARIWLRPCRITELKMNWRQADLLKLSPAPIPPQWPASTARSAWTRVSRIAFILFFCFGSVARAQYQSDKLDAAKQAFREAESKQAAKVISALRGLVERSQNSGDLDAVIELKKELDAFGSFRKSPASVSMRSYDVQLRQLVRRLNVVFENEVRDLTKAGDIDNATALQKELVIHQADDFRTLIEIKWIPIFVDGQFGDKVSNWDFTIDDGLLRNAKGSERTLFSMVPVRNFRAKIKYVVPDAGAEAALVLRCPNARKSREIGYAVGLCSPNGWIYNVNKVYHYEHGTAGAKKLLDITGEANAAIVTIGEPHTVEVVGNGSTITTYFDGRFLHTLDDERFQEGTIGLEYRHGSVIVERFEYAVLPD